MDINSVKKALTALPGVDVSKIDSISADSIFDSVVQKAKEQVVFSIWDKVTPINGAHPNSLLSTFPHCIDDWKGLTGLVKVGDFFLHVISHDFNSEGWTPIETEEKLKEISLPIIEKAILGKIVEHFIPEVLNAEGDV